MRLSPRLTYPALALLFLFGLVGCGASGSTPPGSTDEAEAFVASLDDITGAPGSLPNYFVKGAAPDKATLRKYASYSYAAVGKPSVRGAEATVKIKITDRSGKEVGEKEWALAKDGNQWKLKSAPLP